MLCSDLLGLITGKWNVMMAVFKTGFISVILLRQTQGAIPGVSSLGWELAPPVSAVWKAHQFTSSCLRIAFLNSACLSLVSTPALFPGVGVFQISTSFVCRQKDVDTLTHTRTRFCTCTQELEDEAISGSDSVLKSDVE